MGESMCCEPVRLGPGLHCLLAGASTTIMAVGGTISGGMGTCTDHQHQAQQACHPGHAHAIRTTALRGMLVLSLTLASQRLTRVSPSRLNAHMTRLHEVRPALPAKHADINGMAKRRRPNAPALRPKRAANTSHTICIGALPPAVADAGSSTLPRS